jgi:hypothetical protein
MDPFAHSDSTPPAQALGPSGSAPYWRSPPLGAIDIDEADCLPDWIICGGESGTDTRRMKPAWARAVRDQCADLGIAFFMKQTGSNHRGWPMNIRGKGDDMDEWPEDLQIRQFPSGKRAW